MNSVNSLSSEDYLIFLLISGIFVFCGMNHKLAKSLLLGLLTIFFFSCSKESSDSDEPMLYIKLVVDSNQARLGNTGFPATVPSGHAAQSPRFNKISAHYLELAPNALTALGTGAILYHAPETNQGGATAIDFSRSKVVSPGEQFLAIPLKDVPAGSYTWVRLSLSYQNYEVDYYLNSIGTVGTVASFVGYNQYISSYPVNTLSDTVNSNKPQGYWAFETIGALARGQSPAGATTVVNPIFATSPIPQGSCVVTGSFSSPLVITAEERADITLTMSLSTNHSFEWIDANANGKWDLTTSPASVEQVVDMGLRGLIPTYGR